MAVFKVFIPASETLLLSSPIIHFMSSPDVRLVLWLIVSLLPIFGIHTLLAGFAL